MRALARKHRHRKTGRNACRDAKEYKERKSDEISLLLFFLVLPSKHRNNVRTTSFPLLSLSNSQELGRERESLKLLIGDDRRNRRIYIRSFLLELDKG